MFLGNSNSIKIEFRVIHLFKVKISGVKCRWSTTPNVRSSYSYLLIIILNAHFHLLTTRLKVFSFGTRN